jgi:hypothetical protein
VLPIHWSPAEAATLQQQITAAQACSRQYQQLLEAVKDAAAAAAAASATGSGALVLDAAGGAADQAAAGSSKAGAGPTTSSSRPTSAAGTGTTPRGSSPSRLRPASPHLTHSLTTGKQLPAVAAAAAAATGLVDPRPAWVLAGRAIGKRPGEGAAGEGGASASDTLSRPASPAAGQAVAATTSSSRPVSAALSTSSSRPRPGSAGAVWLAEQEEQVSGDLLRRLQQRIEAEVRSELAAKGAKTTQRLRSEPSSPTTAAAAAGGLDAVKGAAAGDAGAAAGGVGDVEVQQYISHLEGEVERWVARVSGLVPNAWVQYACCNWASAHPRSILPAPLPSMFTTRAPSHCIGTMLCYPASIT